MAIHNKTVRKIRVTLEIEVLAETNSMAENIIQPLVVGMHKNFQLIENEFDSSPMSFDRELISLKVIDVEEGVE